MKYWYLLNYKIYQFYQSRGEISPDLYSWMGSTFLINMNVYPLIHIWIKQKQYVKLYGIKITSLAQLLPFLLVTYLILYYKDRYVKIFREIDNNRDMYEGQLGYVIYYIVLSIIVFILFAVLS